MEEPSEIKNMDFSFFGKGSVLNGTFLLRGTSHLNAHFEGDITLEEGHCFSIEDEGVLVGTLKSHDVEIFGKFQGTLKASGKVVIHSTAVVSGDIMADRLSVHPNACVNITAHTEGQAPEKRT